MMMERDRFQTKRQWPRECVAEFTREIVGEFAVWRVGKCCGERERGRHGKQQTYMANKPEKKKPASMKTTQSCENRAGLIGP